MSTTTRSACLGLLAACLAVPGLALAEPTVGELYEMLQAQQQRIEKLENDQQRLKHEAEQARADASTARTHAAEASAEATIAKQQLEQAQTQIQVLRGEITDLPDVAAGDQEPAASPGAFASFDALYWDLDGGKEYDYVLRQDPAFLASDDPNGDVETATWDGNWGFRAEGGWRFGNGIDALLRGMRMGAHGSDSETDPGQNMTALALLNEDDDFADVDVGFAEVELDLELVMVDLESGKWFSIGDGVDLRPFVTVRYADLEAGLDSRFCIETDCALTDDVETADSRLDWWGAGILGGIEGEWRFLNNFSLFGRGAAGVLGGEYSAEVLYRDVDDGTEQSLADEDGRTFVPVLEASLGVGVRLFESDAFGVGVEAGYEVLSFFDAPSLFQGSPDDVESTADFDEETITFHGAFLRLGVDF